MNIALQNIINYVVNGDVTVLSGVINPPDLPPKQEIPFTPVSSCDASGCTNLETVIDNLLEAGYVACAGGACPYGFVQAKDTNGNIRILMPGDIVYAGDEILKDKNSCLCIKSMYSGGKVCMASKDARMKYVR